MSNLLSIVFVFDIHLLTPEVGEIPDQLSPKSKPLAQLHIQVPEYPQAQAAQPDQLPLPAQGNSTLRFTVYLCCKIWL